MKLKVMLDPGAKMPEYAHPFDGGMDLFANERKVILPESWGVVDTGTHIAIPKNYVGLVTSKSGLMGKNGITCRGTIDYGYTGSIKAVLYNHSKERFIVEKGAKVTQMVIVPCEHFPFELVENMEETDRGNCGFGSTGAF